MVLDALLTRPADGGLILDVLFVLFIVYQVVIHAIVSKLLDSRFVHISVDLHGSLQFHTLVKVVESLRLQMAKTSYNLLDCLYYGYRDVAPLFWVHIVFKVVE